VRHARLTRRRFAALAFGLGAASARGSPEARLILLERRDCPWCRLWLRDVGERAWNASDLGRRAPLRRVDVAAGLPEDLQFLSDWRLTPTFVLVKGGREIGRILGYAGADFFWQQAEALLSRLGDD
jgi:hypothetical protein